MMKRTNTHRVIAFLVALALYMTSGWALPVFSVADTDSSPSPTGTVSYDYDTLRITRDGVETYRMDLPEYGKYEIRA